jgi:hypothetical protein
VSNCSALAYYPSQRLVTHNMHQSCVRTDLTAIDNRIDHLAIPRTLPNINWRRERRLR